MMYVEVILGSALTTLLSYYLLQRWRIFQTFKKLGIPGPPPSLLLGNLKDIQTHGRHVMLERWNRKYGDFYGFYEGPQPVIVTSDLEVVKKVCVSDHHTYNQRKPPLFASAKDPYTNMFFASGSQWQRLRNISSPAFTGKQMKAMSPLVSRCVDHVMDILETKCEKEVDFNVHELFQCLTLDTIARCAFGMEICSVKEDDNIFLSKCRAMFSNVQGKNSGFKYILAMITAFPSTIEIGKLIAKLFRLSVREWFLTSVKVIIESRQKSPSKENDLIQLMLNAEEVNQEDNGGGESERSKAEVNTGDNSGNGKGSARKQSNKMTIPEIQGQCFLFLLAGYETTSTLLAFVAYRLVIHHELQEKIYTEIKQHFDDECNPDYESSKKCVYLEMFINETLRMHPLAAIAVNRYSCEESVIKGHNIPKCTQVQIDVASIHYNSEHWPEPDVFDPDRFTPEMKASRDTSAFLPFGAGHRICIGTRFAMMEAKITLIRILHQYRFTKSPTMSVPIVESNNGIKGPTEGVQVIVYPRC